MRHKSLLSSVGTGRLAKRPISAQEVKRKLDRLTEPKRLDRAAGPADGAGQDLLVAVTQNGVAREAKHGVAPPKSAGTEGKMLKIFESSSSITTYKSGFGPLLEMAGMYKQPAGD
jgi:hypothetical protein